MNRSLKILLILGVVVGISIFSFKSCGSLRKTDEIGDQEFTAEEIISNQTVSDNESPDEVDAVKNTEAFDVSKYKEAFIKANTEFTCEILKDKNYTKNVEIMKNDLSNSYTKYELPVENNEIMIAILEAYDNDKEVINTIKEDAKKCADAN